MKGRTQRIKRRAGGPTKERPQRGRRTAARSGTAANRGTSTKAARGTKPAFAVALHDSVDGWHGASDDARKLLQTENKAVSRGGQLASPDEDIAEQGKGGRKNHVTSTSRLGGQDRKQKPCTGSDARATDGTALTCRLVISVRTCDRSSRKVVISFQAKRIGKEMRAVRAGREMDSTPANTKTSETGTEHAAWSRSAKSQRNRARTQARSSKDPQNRKDKLTLCLSGAAAANISLIDSGSAETTKSTQSADQDNHAATRDCSQGSAAINAEHAKWQGTPTYSATERAPKTHEQRTRTRQQRVVGVFRARGSADAARFHDHRALDACRESSRIASCEADKS
jgi:hypothetical protein